MVLKQYRAREESEDVKEIMKQKVVCVWQQKSAKRSANI